MARFRAYATDSSSDEEGEVVGQELEDSTQEESADEASSPAPVFEGGSGDDADDDGDELEDETDGEDDELYEEDDQEDGEESDSDESTDSGDDQSISQIDEDEDESSKPSHDMPFDPASWTRRGLDAQKIRVMQASYFRQPEESATLRALNEQAPRRHQRKHSRESEGDIHFYDSRERASFDHTIELPVFRPSRKYARVQVADSAATGCDNAFIDAGLAFGRSFRVGWGPSGMLAHPGAICGVVSSKTTANSTIYLSRVSLAPDMTTPMSERFLQHHLAHTQILPDDDGIPFADPSVSNLSRPVLNFESFTKLFGTTDDSDDALIFRLGHALFDPMDLRLADSVPPEIRDRAAHLRRKAALSSWLKQAVEGAVANELRSPPPRVLNSHSAAASAYAIFTYLTGHQIENACNEAVKGKFFRLATLIAQVSDNAGTGAGDPLFCEDVMDQLRIWRTQKIDVHIDEFVRRIYALLAGVINSQDTAQGQSQFDNVSKDLDWKRLLGLYLWYIEPVDSSVTDVWEVFTQHSPSTAVSRPSTTQKHSLPGLEKGDLLYGLVRLFADPACSLSEIFDPFAPPRSRGSKPPAEGSSADSDPPPQMADYTLPWHLYILLSRCMQARDFPDRQKSESDGWVNEYKDDATSVDVILGHSPTADLLCSSYAYQLESLGMLQEAVFVLEHIEGGAGRKRAIGDLLARQAAKLDEWCLRALVGSLNLPMGWVLSAQATYALECNHPYQAYEILIRAAQFHMNDDPNFTTRKDSFLYFQRAHTIAMTYLAPEAILRQDWHLLKTLFAPFEGQPVEGWDIGGKVLMEFTTTIQHVAELQELRQQDGTAVADSTHATAMEHYIKIVIPRLMGILPDIMQRSDVHDPRGREALQHKAALREMLTCLTELLSRENPLVASTLPAAVTEGTKLQLIRNAATTLFMRRVEQMERL
ncbi:hypothetical protein FISHEDRAFT_38847 [Fistulina hepatica ATCC 64428]|uniref:Nuclear pore complex protein NUP96 C-terminal domain-containing protein n=1 Tax=Fistulina hepatica ATCC 64428 TaxID=1128425 RepID=A0A0D7AJA5_9AGAR|nr:hypothetical protein FISHEDRAFT_38847 [Fistulina hepatica ATCC 64428]